MANEEQLDPVEQVFLHAYPNPDRVGCPGDNVVQAIARKSLPLNHPAREHLAQCSPCYSDFRRFQREDRTRSSRIRVLGTVAALLIVGIVSWNLLSRKILELEPQHRPAARIPGTTTPEQQVSTLEPPVTVAVLTLEGLSRTRGANNEPVQSALQRLPRKPRLSLSIYLPLGSEEGEYELRLLRSEKELNRPISVFRGTATIQRGLTMFPITADFSALQSGRYVLAFRRGNESWYFGSVALE